MTSADVQAMSQRFMETASGLGTLYQMDSEAHMLKSLVDLSGDEELTQDEREAIEEEIDRLIVAMATKIDHTAALIIEFEHRSGGHEIERQRQAAAKKRYQAVADRLREGLHQHLIANRKDRVDTARFTVALRLNPPAVQVLDEHAVPDEFWRPETLPPEDKPESRCCSSCGAALVVSKSGVMTHWRATGGKSTPTGTVGGSVPPGIAVERKRRVDVR